MVKRTETVNSKKKRRYNNSNKKERKYGCWKVKKGNQDG